MNETPAQLLAAVLRVVAPPREVSIRSESEIQMQDEAQESSEWFDPTSKDDLARVVAMLTGEQLERFDCDFNKDTPEARIVAARRPSAILLTPNWRILAAIVAATGVEA